MSIQEILEAHEFAVDVDYETTTCTCGLWKYADCIGNVEAHRAHVAEVLDKHMQEREAEAFAKGQASVKRGYNAFGESFDDPANPYETESTNGR